MSMTFGSKVRADRYLAIVRGHADEWCALVVRDRRDRAYAAMADRAGRADCSARGQTRQRRRAHLPRVIPRDYVSSPSGQRADRAVPSPADDMGALLGL